HARVRAHHRGAGGRAAPLGTTGPGPGELPGAGTSARCPRGHRGDGHRARTKGESTMKAVRILLVLAVGFCVACDEQAPPETSFAIHFQAVDDRGKDLEGIEIRVGETLLGATDGGGSLQVQVQAREGERYPLDAPCPESYEPRDPPTEM